MNRRTCVVLLSLASFVCAGVVTGSAETVMTRHVREATLNGQATLTGRLPRTQILQLNVVLPLRNPSGLDDMLADLNATHTSSTNPRYRRYLTPAEFTERFGPSQQDYDAVVRYAQDHGLAVVGGSRDGMDVQVRGSVSAIEAAFHVNLLTYQHPTENRFFYAPDREPTTDLPFPLWHISGLDNYSIPHPVLIRRTEYAQALGVDPGELVNHETTGSGPEGSFLGSDMRAAYYGATTLTGASQNLGLLEFAGTDLADLKTYYKNVKQTNTVPITLLSVDGTSTNCVYADGCDDTVQTIDMTQALGMAPGLASLVMYIGSTDTAIISSMTTHTPLPTTIGCSWSWEPVDRTTLDPYFKRMSIQGQNFFAASDVTSGHDSSWPAEDPYVVAVGGTDLVTEGPGGPWKSETGFGGGGISPDGIPIPPYQKLPGVINSRNKGSHTLRNLPDVSANANFSFYVCADQQPCTANIYGGTSFPAPMWAGYVALANEQRVTDGNSSLSFINPYLYSFGVSSNYDTDFHDIVKGESNGFSCVKGYDLVTGWGTPNGQGLIDALVGEK
jgi:subtilase family serine protease